MNDEATTPEEELFEGAAELPAAERGPWLRERCGADGRLLTRVERLLAALDAAEGEAGADFLEEPPAELPSAPAVGGEFAGFRIVRRIASGGMGTVYEAEQRRPRRTVALKVVHQGFAAPEHLARLEREAEVLARLQHPGIAQIFDAGVVEGELGPQPWFSMELVRGRTLLRYAEEEELDLSARLELVAAICDAVHHAHLFGVVHRDLKPDNILVDGSGAPRVLDFAVARVTGADLQLTTLATEPGRLIGTLPYMSPEQVRGDSSAIDARSDVFALGVVLFELCLLYTSPSPRDGLLSRMPSSA